MESTGIKWIFRDRNLFRNIKRMEELKSDSFKLTGSRGSCYLSFYTRNNKGHLRLHVTKREKQLNLIVHITIVKKNKDIISKIVKAKYRNCLEKTLFQFRKPIDFFVNIDEITFLVTNRVEKKEKLYKKKYVLRNFHQFYINQRLCDVVIILRDIQINAHSLILAAISPHFMSMFNAQCGKENRLVIDFSNDPEMDPKVTRGLLDYAYGLKSVNDLKDVVIELLIISDRYRMRELKLACELYVSDHLNTDNSYPYAMLACLYKCKILLRNIAIFEKNHVIPRAPEDTALLRRILGNNLGGP